MEIEDLDTEDKNSGDARPAIKYRVNPFYDIYKSKLTRINKKIPIYETIGGEVRKGSYMDMKDNRVVGKIDVDDPSFFERWARLSSTAMTLIMFILHKLPSGIDKVTISSTEFKRKTGIDLSSFYRARNQLINEGWIQYYELSKTYWINYSRVGKGNTVGPYHNEEKFRILESVFNKGNIAR